MAERARQRRSEARHVLWLAAQCSRCGAKCRVKFWAKLELTELGKMARAKLRSMRCDECDAIGALLELAESPS
jgi:hypothetical protein